MKKTYTIYFVSICLVIGLGFVFFSTPAVAPHVTLEKNTDIDKKLVGKTISLNFVGDILAARAVELAMRKNGYDYPFLKIVDALQDAHITFANLETPLIGTATSGKTTVGGTTVFRGDVAFADALKRAGIDIVSLANNHMKDQGEKGLFSTLETLDTVGVRHVGAGKDLTDARKVQILEVEGVRVGYLAYNDADVVPASYHATDVQAGTNIMDIERLRLDVALARAKTDVLIVSMHSGTEYITDKPNSRQTAFAYAAIDAGADIVIGHHPHVLQPMELYKGKYIFYSLGNFIFDQPWPDTKESALLNMQITLDASGNIETITPRITPLVIQNFQPQETPDVAKQKLIISRFTKNPQIFTIGKEKIFVEIANTTQTRSTGLSYRKYMPKETGLLFVFEQSGRPGIWMKDMLFPIDIYWFDKDFKLVDARYSISPETYPDVFYPKADVVYVLETPAGVLSPMSLTENLTAQLTYIY